MVRRRSGTGLAARAAGLFASVALALASFAPDARADDATDGRVRRLEEALERQARETERLRREFDAYRSDNPAHRLTQEQIGTAMETYLAATAAPGFTVAGPAPSRGIRWGGYVSLEFHDATDAPSYFDLHRLIFSAEGSITDRIDFRAELEIEHGGISDEIDGEIVVEQAEVIFRVCDSINPKFGWLLVPFGRFNLQHDDPINDFTARPFTGRFLVPTGFGQPGVGVEGARPFGAGHLLTYDVAFTNGYRDAFTADEGVREARHSRDENHGKQVWGRVAASWKTCFLDTLETGVSGTYGIYDDEDRNDITGWALDLLLRKGPFELKGEYIAYHYDRDSADPVDAIEGQSGLWLEAAWHFFPCAWRGCTQAYLTDTSLFTLAARYQWMDLDDAVDGATFEDDLEAWSVGLNYRVTERTVFRIDHTWFDSVNDGDRREWTASISTYF
jgi:hypothetical protein